MGAYHISRLCQQDDRKNTALKPSAIQQGERYIFSFIAVFQKNSLGDKVTFSVARSATSMITAIFKI